jgi:transcriptional regulator with XRE-family HTH domain
MIKMKELRQKAKLSQAELARRAGLNANTVGMIESGRLAPYESQLTKLAKALGLENQENELLMEVKHES